MGVTISGPEARSVALRMTVPRESAARATGAGAHRINTIDALRGLASLSVCWFHLTNGNPRFLSGGALWWSGHYGWLGVSAFFVISGFIIPYALYTSGYATNDYGRFVARRIMRLDPPYLLSIAVVVLLAYLGSIAPGYSGDVVSVSWAQIASHIGFITAFTNYRWLNPVYWSLAIEFQYYLLVGLAFPLIVHQNRQIRWVALVGMITLSAMVRSPYLLWHYMPLFALGILAFWFRVGLASRLTVAASALAIAATSPGLSGVVAVAGVTVAVVIAADRLSSAPLTGLGAISYSLYLTHVPIGGRIVNLGSRVAETMPEKALVVLVALATSVLAAAAFHQCVELPCQRWASSVRFKGRLPAPPEPLFRQAPNVNRVSA
jgi:peptidoglycan/LPS O-acetylase OafA/YrhL